jgi:hypothetical protein
VSQEGSESARDTNAIHFEGTDSIGNVANDFDGIVSG